MKIPGVDYRVNCKYCSMNPELLISDEGVFSVYAYDEPFNNGHLVIVPKKHVPFSELSSEEVYEALRLVRKAEMALRRIYNPHGFNVGIVYQPHAAFHIVPRWNGDVSFVKVFFDVKPIPETPLQYAARIKAIWGSLTSDR